MGVAKQINSKRENPMSGNTPDISIIIVNYKVKDYIALLLQSIKSAQGDLSIEIFVVDNNSEDDSIEYLSSRFSDVRFITNSLNEGFGKANNQALKQAKGNFTLIINPDTIIEENSLSRLKKYMDNNQLCGVAGFRMINYDGTFARECRRSIPDLKSAFFRATALDSLFPKNKLIGKRYLGWLSQFESHKVDVVSGAGMFWRTSVLEELGGFDEDFFMYGEDDDLCFRIQNTSYHIAYLPFAVLLHFKGESEREFSLAYLKKVNEGLLLFFKKHASDGYTSFFRKIISLGYYIRVIIIYLSLTFKKLILSSQKLKSSLILVSSKEPDVELKEKLNRLSAKEFQWVSGTPKEELSDRISTIQERLGTEIKIVFDIESISFENIFETIEKLKGSKVNFQFLDSKENKIVGKASVIEL